MVITQTAAQQSTEGTTNDISIATAPVSFTWTKYAFAQHSDWVNVFQAGSGTMQLWENLGGQRQPKVLYSKEIPLTPGPLVVALKVALNQDPADPSKYWPPSEPDQVETIAASYVPPATGDASVRLFNLSPDTTLAGMTSDGSGAATISDVHFSLGSKWVGFPLGKQTFTIVDDDLTPRKTLLRVTQV